MKNQATKPNQTRKASEEALHTLVIKELASMLTEPRPDSLWMELAFWRAAYKANLKLTHMKASAAAKKSVHSKRVRIESAHIAIEQAIDALIKEEKKVTHDSVAGQLLELNNPDIYSEEESAGSRPLVRSGTIRKYLSVWHSKKKEQASTLRDR